MGEGRRNRELSTLLGSDSVPTAPPEQQGVRQEQRGAALGHLSRTGAVVPGPSERLFE